MCNIDKASIQEFHPAQRPGFRVVRPSKFTSVRECTTLLVTEALQAKGLVPDQREVTFVLSLIIVKYSQK